MQDVIAVDFDDVIVDFNSAFSAYHNRVFGTNVTYEAIFTHEMQLVYGCAREVIIERVEDFYQSEEHAQLGPIAGVQNALQQLEEENVLHVLTNRPAKRRRETEEWLAHYCPNVFTSVNFTNLFGGEEHDEKLPKSAVCHRLGAKILIEDAPRHAAEAAANGVLVIMPTRPWNRNEILPPGVIRFDHWDDIASFLLGKC